MSIPALIKAAGKYHGHRQSLAVLFHQVLVSVRFIGSIPIDTSQTEADSMISHGVAM